MKFKYAVIIGFLLLTIGFIHAQSPEETCPAIVTQALQTLDQTCNALDRNSVCYGNHEVTATFSAAVAEGFFSKPADKSPLTQISTLQTAPLNLVENRWGIALMNVQANVPNTLPGQGVIFVLMGDAQIENRVPAETIVNVAQPVTVVASTGANLRAEPSPNAAIVASVPEGTPLQADLRNENGEWLRILHQNTPLWIHVNVLLASEVIHTLPVANGATMSPMQAFQFTTGIGQPECRQARGSLLIQGPNNVRVEIEANGAKINIGSTILLGYNTNHDLNLYVLSGAAYVDGLSIPAGFMATAPTDATGTVTAKFGQMRRIPPRKLGELGVFSQIPPSLMHYVVDLPTNEEIATMEQAQHNPGGYAPQQPAAPAIVPQNPAAPRNRGSRRESDRGSGRGSD